MAMGVGASGILGGRAFWKEYFLQDGSRCAQPVRRDDRPDSGSTEVDALVRSQGTPWFARYGFSKDELATVRAAEGWHAAVRGTRAVLQRLQAVRQKPRARSADALYGYAGPCKGPATYQLLSSREALPLDVVGGGR